MKKCYIFMLCACMFALSGCQGKENRGTDKNFVIYYLDQDKASLKTRDYELSDFTSDKVIEECFKELKKAPHRGVAAVPDNVELEKYSLSDKQLQCYFNDVYAQMDATTEVLCRAAIVKTVLQIPGIDTVSFYVNDQPLLNRNDRTVGVMNEESFVENDDEMTAYKMSEVTLYFADSTGEKLIPVTKELTYNSNVSIEKTVVEQLLKGPDSDGTCATIPTGTQVISVSVKNGVCYVNLTEGFLQQTLEVTENVTIYSIVNSLVELSSVNSVQISINGDSNIKYRNSIDLSSPLIRNLDIVQQN